MRSEDADGSREALIFVEKYRAERETPGTDSGVNQDEQVKQT